MTAAAALAEAVRRLRGVGYDYAKLDLLQMMGGFADEWEIPAEVDRTKLALCRGYVAHALRDAWDLCDEPRPLFRMLVGPMASGTWHAMLEMKDGDTRTWADVQSGEISPPEWFASFTPKYAYTWGPVVEGMGFGAKTAIEEDAR